MRGSSHAQTVTGWLPKKLLHRTREHGVRRQETKMSESENLDLCDDCKMLVGAGRNATPHRKLKPTRSHRVSSAMGPADEDYYECTVCGHKWLHETGSCGYGWIK